MKRIAHRPDRPHLFLLPASFFILVVAAYPLFYVFWLSLCRRLLIFKISEFAGFENYRFLLKDERFWNAFWNTFYFTGTSVILELLLGLGIAVLLHWKFSGKGWLLALVLVPWAIPTVVSAKMWEWMYNADFGILNFLLGTRINWLGNPAWAIHAAILVDVWKATPFAALLLTAGLQNIPQELYQAARLDGASAWICFRRITLPLLKPVLFVVLIFRTLDAFRVFDVIYVLTGGGPANTTETLSVYAYKMLFQTLQFGYGSAISVTVFLAVASLSILYVHVLSRGFK